MPADEVTHGTDVDESRVRTGPRHAAPKKPLFTRFHMPAGKAIALAAMPTAVLMGMGFTPTLANAEDQTSQSLTADEYKDCVAALEDEASASASSSASESADEATPSPSASASESSDSGSDSSSDSGSDDEAEPTPSASASESSSNEEQSGSTATPSASASASESSGNVLEEIGDALTDLFTGGDSSSDSSSSESASPSASASASASASQSADDSDDTVKDTTDKVTDTVEDTVKDVTDSASKAAEDTTDAVEEAAESATASPSAGASTDADDCPAATDDESGVDNKTAVANDPWYLEASSLLLKGASYKGVVEVKMANGKTKKVLKYVISDGTDIGDLHQLVKDDQSGKTYHVQAGEGTTSTIRDGETVMYTESISGNLLGLIPVTFTPDNPPPLDIPIIYFTNVKITQAAQFGGTLTVPGMHQYTTD